MMVLKKHNYLAVNLSATSNDNSEHTYTCGMTRDGGSWRKTRDKPMPALGPVAHVQLRCSVARPSVVMASNSAAGNLNKKVSARLLLLPLPAFLRANQHLAPLCLEGRQRCVCGAPPEHHAETESKVKHNACALHACLSLCDSSSYNFYHPPRYPPPPCIPLLYKPPAWP